MDSGGEEPAGEDDSGEPEDPSISDLAEELDAGDDADDQPTPGSFADLVSEIQRRRPRSSEPGGDDASRGSGPASDGTEAPDGATSASTGPAGIDWGWHTTGADASDAVAIDRESVLETVGDARNVLLTGELLSPAEDSLCTTLLGLAQPANVVLVTMTQSPDERLAMCRRHLGPSPGRIAVVNVGDPVRSGGDRRRTTDADGSVVVESVADPTDLMRIGITISRQLSEFEGDDAPILVCFHSLTALLQFVEDRRSVFRFIHTLRGRIRAAGGLAHYHLDDEAHDDQVVALLRPLFDVTLEFDGEGEVRGRTFP